MAALSISIPFAQIALISLSPLVGSFLALLADRLPRGEDAVVKRSYCRDCETPLGPADLIPLFSFIFSGGKCRHCKSKISWHLPFTELSAIFIALFAVWRIAYEPLLITETIFMWIMLAIFITNLRFLQTPNILKIVVICLAVTIVYINPEHSVIIHLVIGVLAAGVFLLTLNALQKARYTKNWGTEHLALVTSIAIVSGPVGMPIIILVASLLTFILHLVRAVITGPSKDTEMPWYFGSILCLSVAIFWATIGF